MEQNSWLKKIIAPSILSADFSRLGEEIKAIEKAGADWVHIDVMDGHFVPNITIGPVVVAAMRRVTDLTLDVHLMIEEPLRFIPAFIKAGSNMITVHCETIDNASFKKIYSLLRKNGIKIGVSLNPKTSLKRIEPYLDFIDYCLVMSVNPGFGGQEFISTVIPKIERLRRIFAKDIEVDGGVNEKVAPKLIEAGATILVAGSFIFGSNDPKEAIRSLRYG